MGFWFVHRPYPQAVIDTWERVSGEKRARPRGSSPTHSPGVDRARPAYVYQRALSQQLFETLGPGDIVTVTDAFARDPVTGNRGMSLVPGVTVKASYSLGGAEPSDPTAGPSPQVGTCEVLVFPFDRPSVYAPSGQIDHSVSSGGFLAGYSSGTNTIRLLAHAYTPSTANADATHFVALDKIEITEVDPDNPAGLAQCSETDIG